MEGGNGEGVEWVSGVAGGGGGEIGHSLFIFKN